MKRISLAFLLSIIVASSFAEPELKGSPRELRGFLHPVDSVVSIQGYAQEKAYSDKAIVSLVITTEKKLLSDSISENSELRGKITNLLVKAGINPESIKSSKFSSSPEYGWFGKKPSSYRVVNRMAVSITEEEHMTEVALVADKYKEIELSTTTFEHTKKDELNAKVKAKALAKIIKQKTFYEQSLGLKLSPIGIRDSNIRQRATRGAVILQEAVSASTPQLSKSSSSLSSDKAYKDSEPLKRARTVPSFDEVRYEASLSVDFKIEDLKN